MKYIIAFFVICVAIELIADYIRQLKLKNFEKTEYYKQTHVEKQSMLNDKGRRGEYEVFIKTKRFGKPLINPLLRLANGETTEIDVLTITRAGIFVFEIKNYYGKVTGNATDESWCQNANGNYRYFYSPVRQNLTHVTALLPYVQKWNVPIYPVIVFGNRTEIKIKGTAENKVSIWRIWEVNYRIKKKINEVATNSPDRLLSNKTMEEIYHDLYHFTQVPKEERIIHKKIVACKERRCPNCGGRLEYRESGDLRFMACENAPELCDYFLKMDDIVI